MVKYFQLLMFMNLFEYNPSGIIIAGPREARNPSLDSDQRITHVLCVRTMFITGMLKLEIENICFATKDDQNTKNVSITMVCHMGCRLLSHGRSKHILLTLSRQFVTWDPIASVTPVQTFAGKKLETQRSLKMFFISLELVLGTYINL